MSNYAITGNLGAGKTLVSIGKILDGLKRGVRIATNLDLNVEHLLSGKQPADITRLPDFPSSENLHQLGKGCDSTNEDEFGMIVLDEARMFLGSRSWNESGRDSLIKWLLHARKLGWHCYFICQDVAMIDKQVRTALIEHLVRCRRLDRLRIPVIGSLLQMLGRKGLMPRIHIGVVKYGLMQHDPVVDRWIYQGTHLFDAYDTRQVFDASVYEGNASMLTPDRYSWFRFPQVHWLRRFCDERQGRVWRWLESFAPKVAPQWHPSEIQPLPRGKHSYEKRQEYSAWLSYHDWLAKEKAAQVTQDTLQTFLLAAD